MEMRQTLWFAVLPVILTVAPAMAQLAAGGGQGIRLVTESSSVLAPRPERGNAWKLLTGYQFSQNFGLEAAYGELGRYGYGSGVPGLSALGDVRMRAWSLAGTGQLPLSRSWSVSGKVGVGSNLMDLTRSSGPLGLSPWLPYSGGTGSDMLLGLGLGFHPSRGFGLRFEYEKYGALPALGSGTNKGDHWAINLRYSF